VALVSDTLPSEVSALLDGFVVSNRQRALVALIMAILVIDGVDVQLLALVAPRIMGDFGVDVVAFAPALTAALVGTAIGNYTGGWLGDRVGRKDILVVSTLVFSLATILIGTSRNLPEVTLWRFLGGAGFGAAVPNGLAYCAEWLPHRARTGAMSLLAPAFPIGGVVGAGGTLAILAFAGWRDCFFVFGAVSLAIAFVSLLWLPHSPTALIAQGKREAALRDLRRMVGPAVDLPPACAAGGRPPSAPSIYVAALLRLNSGSTLALLAIAVVTYAMTGWTTTIFVKAGLPLQSAIRSIFVYNFMAVLGSFLVARPIGKFGSRQTMLVLSGAGCCFILLLAAMLSLWTRTLSWEVALSLTIACGLLGFVSGAMVTTIYSVMIAGYPLERRASGMGLGLMFGRIGGIAILGAGGLLLKASGSAFTLFYLILVAANAITALSAIIIDRHLARTTAAP
jgi:AAHS family 4-hydroxybenzoate transporter-like MFS transporter